MRGGLVEGGVIYGYDAAGSLRQKTDADGRFTFFGYYGYDASRRPTTMMFADSVAGETADPWIYYAYDSLGNLKTTLDETGTSTTYYDFLNRVVQKTTKAGTVYYAYDRSGLKTDLKDTDLTESVYVYDAAGRLVTLQLVDVSNPRAAYYVYDPSGLVTTKVLPGTPNATPAIPYNLCTYYTYDVASRLSQLENRTPPSNSILTYFYYQRDNNGNIFQITHEAGGYTYYVYDALDRLTQDLRFTSANAMIYGFYYNYDPASNRYFKYDAAGGSDPTNKTTYYLYDARNLMTKETHSQ